MESIKQALEGTQGDEVVRLLRAVEQGDHHAIDGGRALAHFERLTHDVDHRSLSDLALSDLAP